MTFTIEKNIPIPSSKVAGGLAGALLDMQIGDSVFVAQKPAAINGSVQWAKKKTGFTFVCRTIEGGARVWRTA